MFLMVAGGSALAAKGGGGGHHGGGNPTPTPAPTGTATCSATPNPLPQYGIVTISGSGFPVSTTVSFSLNGGASWVNTDSTGSFSRSGQMTNLGTSTVIVEGYVTCSFLVV
jgi:hypothetical protein